MQKKLKKLGPYYYLMFVLPELQGEEIEKSNEK